MPVFKHMYDYDNNILINSIFILKNYYLNNLFLKKWETKNIEYSETKESKYYEKISNHQF